MERKPLTFYEALSIVFVVAAIFSSPFWWWFVLAPVVYQGLAHAIVTEKQRLFREKRIAEYIKDGIPEELKKDEFKED